MAIQKTGLRKVADAFCIVDCVIMSLTIIAMAWMIPMTVAIRNRIRDNRPVGLGLSICYLIFGGLFGLVAGILLIIDHSNQKQ